MLSDLKESGSRGGSTNSGNSGSNRTDGPLESGSGSGNSLDNVQEGANQSKTKDRGVSNAKDLVNGPVVVRDRDPFQEATHATSEDDAEFMYFYRDFEL